MGTRVAQEAVRMMSKDAGTMHDSGSVTCDGAVWDLAHVIH